MTLWLLTTVKSLRAITESPAQRRLQGVFRSIPLKAGHGICAEGFRGVCEIFFSEVTQVDTHENVDLGYGSLLLTCQEKLDTLPP